MPNRYISKESDEMLQEIMKKFRGVTLTRSNAIEWLYNYYKNTEKEEKKERAEERKRREDPMTHEGGF